MVLLCNVRAVVVDLPEIRRRTVTAMVDCKLCYLHKDDMKTMCERYPELALRLKRCARTETKVNKKGRKFIAAMAEAASGGAPIRGMTTASSFRYANADAANVSGHSLHAHRVHTTHAAESFLPMNNATAGAQQVAAAAAAAAAVSEQLRQQLAEQATMLKAVLATQEQLVAAVARLESRGGDATVAATETATPGATGQPEAVAGP